MATSPESAQADAPLSLSDYLKDRGFQRRALDLIGRAASASALAGESASLADSGRSAPTENDDAPQR